MLLLSLINYKRICKWTRRRSALRKKPSTWVHSHFSLNLSKPTTKSWLRSETTRSYLAEWRPLIGTWIWWWRTCRKCGLRCPKRVSMGSRWPRPDIFPSCSWEGILSFMCWRTPIDNSLTAVIIKRYYWQMDELDFDKIMKGEDQAAKKQQA